MREREGEDRARERGFRLYLIGVLSRLVCRNLGVEGASKQLGADAACMGFRVQRSFSSHTSVWG